ncbi:hypothetical protein CK203_028936 [Vitis vinifera]|uniref:RNase H type-1 domain-containing protein n=1 Tax=Vitis vinifera TaxID=29760 RepID=A0A438IA48_VITVI|nr:hypothetical protein CK203_028936 [Vitis vinifera]
MEQTTLALRMAAQKLRPYFQAHPIIVLTNQPLRNVLHKSNISGRMFQWAIELKYEVILSDLGLATALCASKVRIHSDSQLVVGQIRKEYEAKDERMVKYLLKVQESLSRLGEWAIEKIPMIDNMQADSLAGIAVSFPVKESMLLPIYVQATPAIAKSFICNTVNKE